MKNESIAERYAKRSVRIIERKGVILIRIDDLYGPWYLGQSSNLCWGEDHFYWMTRRHALQFGDLRTAFLIAKLITRHKATVTVVYPKNR